MLTVVEGHSSQYAWKDWLDGRCWLLRENGADFGCAATSMTGQAYTWARLLGVSVTTRLVAGGILLQAYPIGSSWKPNLGAIAEHKIKKALANPR